MLILIILMLMLMVMLMMMLMLILMIADEKQKPPLKKFLIPASILRSIEWSICNEDHHENCVDHDDDNDKYDDKCNDENDDDDEDRISNRTRLGRCSQMFGQVHIRANF